MSKHNKVKNAIENQKRFVSGALMVTPTGDVFSYNVRIFNAAERQLNVTKYSKTTSCHQNLTREVLASMGVEYSTFTVE